MLRLTLALFRKTQTDKIVDLLSLRSAAANQSTAPATTASAVAAPATAESSDSSQILSEAAFQSVLLIALQSNMDF